MWCLRVQFFQVLQVFPCFLQKPPSSPEIPVQNAIAAVYAGDLVQYVPVGNQDPASFPQAVAVTINMVRLCAASIVFKDGKIVPLLQIPNGGTFDVIPSVIKLSGVMADVVKDLQ